MGIISKIYENNVERSWYESSNIYYSEYNDESNQLTIIFQKGGKYVYPDVHIDDYLMFREGGLDSSQGKAFTKFIVKKYPHSEKDNVSLSDYPIIEVEEIKEIVNNTDKVYAKLLEDILENGIVKTDRTGTGTKSIFGTHLKFNLKEGFPLLTGKKMATKAIIHELLWFLKGDTNIKYLVDNNVSIWNDDAFRFYKNKIKGDECGDISKEDWLNYVRNGVNGTLGELGPVYGKQWRDWGGIDQVQNLINTLLTNPDDRRMIISAWNVGDIEKMALPPCHMTIQFYTKITDNGKRELSCSWYQRSVDSFLGLPFNIASYALLTHIIANICDMEVGELTFNGGDTHIYLNHIDVANEFINRVNEKVYQLPTLNIKERINSIDELDFNLFEIINYESHPQLRGELSVGV